MGGERFEAVISVRHSGLEPPPSDIVLVELKADIWAYAT